MDWNFNKKAMILLFLSLVLIFNLLWEFSHAGLYNASDWMLSPLHLIIASLGDVFYVGLIFVIISLKNKGLEWMKKPKFFDYILVILFGILIATGIEIVNVNYLGRWAYKDVMPTIFGIGLTPFLQLFVTGLASLEISRRIKWKEEKIEEN